MPRFKKVTLSLILVLASSTIFERTFSAQAGIIVPAYFYPGTGGSGGTGDGWAQMATAASSVPVTAIFNPNSGPLPGPADPNYVTAIGNLENAGGTVIAYVHTSYGTRSLALVESDISTYISQYGAKIDGFFVDEMTNDSSTANINYYHSLYSYIKGLSNSYQVTGNPGSNTAEAYIANATRGADTLVTYESQASSYAGANPPSWVYNYPASDFANLIYNEPTVVGMRADLGLASQRNVGLVYVTDQNLPNPYAQLPTYWNQEVAALSAVPEPSTIVSALIGVVCVAAFTTIRRKTAKSTAPVAL